MPNSGAIAISATTQLAAVIGDPIRHSLSPVIHNAGFAACGVDAVYVALPVPDGEVRAAVAALRSFGWLGFSVTMPHKQSVIEFCDELTESARRLQSVNCLYWHGDTLVGDSTDGRGYVQGLHADLGIDVAGLRCVLVGAGGAAGAVAFELAAAGATDVCVINRTEAKAVAVAQLAGDVGRTGSPEDLGAADLVINATPLGMGATDVEHDVPFDVSALADHAVVSDLIYHPATTPLLAQAQARGLRSQNGLAMLVHQAVAQFEHWTAKSAPIEAMQEAARSALVAKGQG